MPRLAPNTSTSPNLDLPLAMLTLALCLSPSLAQEGAQPDVAPPEVLHPELSVSLFAREPQIATPIALDVDERGRVWVIESNTHFQPKEYKRSPRDRILILEDTDDDGQADTSTAFADGLEQTMALQLTDAAGKLLLATRRDVLFLEDLNADDRVDSTRYLARLETKENYPHNGLTGFALDGLGHVYFAIGENLSVPYQLKGSDGTVLSGGPDGGSIFRMRLDGSGLERWAFGFWNTFHLTFDAFGRLFAVDNDPDSRPPCRLLHIVRNGDYGYRRWLGRKGLHPFTAWDGELPGTLPMVSGTGEAPSGILAYEHAAAPADLHGQLLVTSWGDYRISVYPLQRRGASFRSHPVPILRGDDSFRPVGIALAPDGSIYFSDWVKQDYHVHSHGRIWRLRPKPKPENRGPTDVRPALQRRAYADLHRLAHLGNLPDALLRKTLEDPSPELRGAALRLASEAGRVAQETLTVALENDDPGVQLEALSILQRTANATVAPARSIADPFQKDGALAERVAQFLGSDDPFLVRAAVDALLRLATPDYRHRSITALQESPQVSEAKHRLGWLLCARGSGEKAAQELLPKFLADPDPAVRHAAIVWIGEERLEAFSEALERSFVSHPTTRPILDAYLAARSLLAGESPEGRDRIAREAALFAIVRDAERPPALRATALRALPPTHAELNAAFYDELLGGGAATDTQDSADPDIDRPGRPKSDSAARQRVRLEAVRSLRSASFEGARALLEKIAGDDTESELLRCESVAGLAAFLPKTEPVLERFAASSTTRIADEAERALRLGATGDAVEQARPTPSRTTLAERGGSAERGERLFFHPRGPNCGGCHAVHGRGGQVGPDLSSAGRLEESRLIDALLDPSKEVAPQFAQWVFVTAEGAHAGVLLKEGADGTRTIGTASGETLALAPDVVLGVKPSTTSIMPDDLLTMLTAAEIQDLMAFLRSLGPPPQGE